LAVVAVAMMCGSARGATPPAPYGPVPSAAQLAWQEDELTLFVHFGMNTFTGRGTGLGSEDPKLFNPTDLDCKQWVAAAKESGFKGMILTAKHHDGFCLWPTATTDHSVKRSTWRDGRGDVVREFTVACHAAGMKAGIYCSPWDRSQPIYDSDQPAYQKLYRAQLTELLSNYGPVYEMWFDGNKANVAAWPDVIKTVRALQPGAVIKQGPTVQPVLEDLRWVGNEKACAPLSNWSIDPPPELEKAGQEKAVPATPHWFPRESDTMLAGHWFWDDNPPRDLPTLLNYYYTSVGRNSILILNVPPDKRGRFSDDCIKRMHEFHDALTTIFGTDLAAGKRATASNVRGNDSAYAGDQALDGKDDTYWATDDGVTSASLEVDLGGVQTFNVVRIEEMIALGQRVAQYKVDALLDDGTWKPVSTGTTIGYRKLDRFPAVKASRVRMTIVRSLACPTICGFGIHMDTISRPASFEPAVALYEVPKRTK
jgi:alpha-L-fucosidase